MTVIDSLIDVAPLYLEGFGVTILLLLVSGVGAFILGVIIAAMRISPLPSLRIFAVAYTETLRNVPLLLVLFFCAFVLPILGVSVGSDPKVGYLLLAMVGLTLYTSPFVAEAVRSGINGVPVGQAEAARSIGMGFGLTLTLVILPQAGRMVVPPLINVFIALTKNTSVAGIFFVNELFSGVQRATRDHGDKVLLMLLLAALLYLAITIPLGQIAGYIEKKVRVLR